MSQVRKARTHIPPRPSCKTDLLVENAEWYSRLVDCTFPCASMAQTPRRDCRLPGCVPRAKTRGGPPLLAWPGRRRPRPRCRSPSSTCSRRPSKMIRRPDVVHGSSTIRPETPHTDRRYSKTHESCTENEQRETRNVKCTCADATGSNVAR